MAFDNSPKRKRQAVRCIYVWEHLRYHQGVMSLLKKTMTAIGNVLHIFFSPPPPPLVNNRLNKVSILSCGELSGAATLQFNGMEVSRLT